MIGWEIALFIWFGITISWANTDARRNDKGKGILTGYHFLGWLIRYILAFLDITFVWFKGDVPYTWETLGVFMVFGGSSWWLFDYFYNVSRQNPPLDWDHVGTSSWLDKWFQKFEHPFRVQATFKTTLIIIGVILILSF